MTLARLTMEHYRDERVGTIKSCLSNHANRVYVDLEKRSARYGKIAETIFRCLTGQTADKPDTRRPQSWAALRAVATANGNSEDEVRVVLDDFRHPDCCFLTQDIRKKYSAEQGGGTYKAIWQRFFSPSRALTPVEKP